jgi:hypothetical protein
MQETAVECIARLSFSTICMLLLAHEYDFDLGTVARDDVQLCLLRAI